MERTSFSESQRLESFQDYLKSEFKIDYAAVEFKYSHSITLKVDKPTNKLLTYNNILVGVNFYDKNLKLLESANYKFVNNVLARSYEKKLINIAPAELNNKFMIARRDIVQKIRTELLDKEAEIKNKLQSLNAYVGVENQNVAISDEFKGEQITLASSSSDKKSFDM